MLSSTKIKRQLQKHSCLQEVCDHMENGYISNKGNNRRPKRGTIRKDARYQLLPVFGCG